MTLNAVPNRRPLSNATLLLIALLFGAAPAFAQRATVQGKVQSIDGKNLRNATVLVVETQRSTTTDRTGHFSLPVPEGDWTLLATATGFEVAQQRITVGSAGSEAPDLVFTLTPALSQFSDELVVIGSRAVRTTVESAVPVDVLSENEIVDTGMTETSRALQFLAPSFNHSTSTISDGSDIVRPSTLRGLGPDQTLVLVNGRRRHNSALVHVNGSIGRGTAGVDLNALPMSAIESIEVLRDGAAAQYGSDAIAGVINIRLRQAVGTRVTLNAGRHFAGDGDNYQVGISHGWRLRERGFLNLTAEYRDRSATNRAGRDPRRIFNFLEQEFGEPALANGTLDPREETYDRRNHRYGDAAAENATLFLNSMLPLNDTTDLYFYGGLSERDGESAGFNRLPSQGRTNILLYPEGHLPLINTGVDDHSWTVGLRKLFSSGWSLDASFSTGGNRFNFLISDSANTSLGLDSPTAADAGTLEFAQQVLNVDAFRAFGPFNLAFGGEWREDHYEIQAGASASWIDGGVANQFGGVAPAGIQVFPGFRPANEVDASRGSLALYGDLEWQISEPLLLGVATRYEDYDAAGGTDVGSTLDGKLSFRYAFNERLALRGAAATGFRAPSLQQALFNNISTQFVDVNGEIVPLEVGTFRVDSDVAQALGAVPLREETSTSFSLGFTAQPNDNLSVTLDLFQVDIDDRVVISGRFQASNPQVAPILEPFGVSAAQFFSNAISTETEGADLVVAWSRALGDDASLALTAAANWNRTRLAGRVQTPPQLVGLGETLFPLIDRTYLELAQPQELYNVGARYQQDRWTAQLRFNYFGEVTSTESNTDPSARQTFGGKWLTDFDLSYELRDGVRLSIGGNNVLDVYPDRNIARNSFNGIFVYPRRTAPFGFNGGYYYTRLTVDF